MVKELRTMADNRAVLLLGAVTRVAVPIARSLSRRGIRVIVGDLSEAEKPALGRFVSRHARLPGAPASSLFASALSDLIAAECVDMLMPCSDAALVAVTGNYDRLRALVYPGCPSPKVVATVLDKAKTLSVAQDVGIDIPESFYVDNPRGLLALRSRLRFPVILKPRDTSKKSLFKVRYLYNFDSLKGIFDEGDLYGRMLIQEYCDGEGVGIGAIISKGEPLALFQHRRLKELPSSGGVSVLAIAEKLDSELATSAVTLLRKLDWDGVAMVEFRQNRHTKRSVLMEVNGRYWGSLALPLAAGVDFPYIQWQLAHGLQPTAPPGYRVGTRVRWLAGDAERMIDIVRRKPADSPQKPSRLNEFVKLITDFAPPTRSSTWAIRDPVPELAELLLLARRLLKQTFARAMRAALGAQRYGRLWEVRSLGARPVLSYMLNTASRALRASRPLPRLSNRMVRSILFLCKGNIIRSPLAAELLRQRLGSTNSVIPTSGGLRAVDGASAHPWAVKAAHELGLSLENHRAQRVTPELVGDADAIFVMDRVNEAELLAQYPKARTKTYMLGDCSDSRAGLDILDPDGTTYEQVRRCYATIEERVAALADLIRAELPK